MKTLYNLGVHLIVLGSLLRNKSRPQFFKRLGVGFPRIDKQGRKLIWIHAVSVGEMRAVAPLIKRLKQEKNPPLIILSTVTNTGHAEGKRAAPEADYHVFLPFDLSYRIRPLVKRLMPDLVLLTETDFWKHFQAAAHEVGAPIVLINGKVSERSFQRFSFLKSFTKELIHPLDHLCVQGELYAKRFAKLGVPLEKITNTGNLKLDGFVEEKSLDLGFSPDDWVITLGSTHDPEEKLCLEALKPLLQRYEQLKVVVVPRHPERFEVVAQLLEKTGLPYSRFTNLKPGSRLVLMDAMGQLRKCYKLSTMAFVGGSFTRKVGGHNILEPAFYGVPVLYGPHMHAQPDLLDLCRAYKAGLEVTPENFALHVEQLLMKAHSYGHNGLKLIHEASGALDKTYAIVKRFLALNKSAC